MRLNILYRKSYILETILISVLFVSCRTSPKSASSEKPDIPKYKMVIEYSFSKGIPYIWDPRVEANHFLITDASTNRGNAFYIDLNNGLSHPVVQTNSYDDNHWMNRDVAQYNFFNSKLNNDEIEIKLQGKNESYKIYSFSEGWSPIPNTIRSGKLESFSGNIQIVQFKNGIKKTLVTQKIKNRLIDEINNRILFVGYFKYLVYLDGEEGGMGRVYVIEL